LRAHTLGQANDQAFLGVARLAAELEFIAELDDFVT
jgi:hypothetical protein